VRRDEDGEAPYEPRHLAPRFRINRSSRSGRDDEPGRLRRFGLFRIVLAILGVMLLAAGVTLMVTGSGSDSEDGSGGDRVAATDTAAADDASSGDTADAGSAGAGGEGESASGEIPSVERPARPVGAPVLLDVDPSPPVSVEIPSLGITSDLVDLQMGADGKLQAPTDFGTAGWFAAGPQPGQPGPAVIAGHVDSRAGPAIFFRLSELQPQSVVLVHREDGSTVTFSVVETEQYPKDAFPSTKVYGPTPGPELRLITCGGVFDAARHSYRDNIVVYARAMAS
jgi:hypothetical protein